MRHWKGWGGFVFTAHIATGCITTESEGFVNYKAVGDVYGTKPQAVDYEEVGSMATGASGFAWDSCDLICHEAVTELKRIARSRGGDSLIDVSYIRDDEPESKTPTCTTHWYWAYFYVAPVLGPWVKTCDITGVAVARVKAKERHERAEEQRGQPAAPPSIQIKINNTQSGQAPAH